MPHPRVKRALDLADELQDELEGAIPRDWLALYRQWLEENVTEDVENEHGRPKDVVFEREHIEAFKEDYR